MTTPVFNEEENFLSFLSLFFSTGENQLRTVVFQATEEAKKLYASIIDIEGGNVFSEETYNVQNKVSEIATKHVIDFFFELLALELPEVDELLEKYLVKITVEEKNIHESIENIAKEKINEGVEQLEKLGEQLEKISDPKPKTETETETED